MDLDALFSAEALPPSPAQSLFTNRVTECESFEEARRHVLAEAGRRQGTVEELRNGRTNVLAFYGMGGMGKTSLSLELERRAKAVLAKEVPTDDALVLTSRTDFSRPSSFSLELQLLQLRVDLLHRDFVPRAFDLAFGVYWAKAHPNEDLDTYLAQRGLIFGAAHRIGLGEQFDEALDETLNAIGAVRTGRRILALLSDAFMDRVRRRRVMGACPFFAPILEEPEPERMLPYMASLLGWELIQTQQRQPVEVVVFWDVWERVQRTTENSDSDVENLLTHIAYLMPTALFVVTGRNRLTWGDEKAHHHLKYGGPERWPMLQAAAVGEPRQHLLGSLSDKDRRSFLVARLPLSADPGVAEIIRRVADGSLGLPLYLDLSATRVDQMLAKGERLRPEEFGGPLEELVVRVTSGLTKCERNLLRAASLSRAFDPEILRAAVAGTGLGAASDAELSKFVGYDFIHRQPAATLPYSLHERLRDSVGACDDVSIDPWSEREWQAAAAGALAVFEKRLGVTALDEPEGLHADRGRLIWGLEAFDYAARAGAAPDWLLAVLLTQRSLGEWAELDRQCRLPHEPASPFGALVLTMRALAEAKTGDLAEAETLYRSVLSAAGATDQLRRFAELQYAELAMLQGRGAEAAAVFRALVAGGSVYAGTARQHLAYQDWRAGRYPEALAWARDHAEHALRRVHALDLHGLVALETGDFAESEARLRAALEVAESSGTPNHLATESRHLARVLALTRPDEGVAAAQQAIEYNRACATPIGESQSHAALAVALSGRGRLDEAAAAIEASLAALQAVGASDGSTFVFPAVAALHTACRRRDAGESRQAVRRLGTSVDHPVWAAVGSIWHEQAFGETLPERELLARLSLPTDAAAFVRAWTQLTPTAG